LVLPLYTKEKLVSLFLLGEKKSGDIFTDNDLKILEIIASQAATALDNARLHEELRISNIELDKKVKIRTREVNARNLELKRKNKEISEFISIASHQLRTPLTIIKGYVSMLLEGSFGKLRKKQENSLDKVFKSNERLINFVNTLLDVSRLDEGRMQYDWEKTKMEEMAYSVVDELMPNAKKKDLALNFHDPKKKLPEIMADKLKLRQVAFNLVDNSIKYTNKGHVDVSVWEEKGKVYFQVKDTGIGMSPEILSALFKKFSRGQGITLVFTEGAGLGLYVCRKLIEDHGGKIWAESEGPGKGSTFTFWLPVGFVPKKKK
jgi:signal transduction histidine kinase